MSRFDDHLKEAARPLAGEPLPPEVLDEALDSSLRARPTRAFIGLGAIAVAAMVATGIGIGMMLPGPTPEPTASVVPSPPGTAITRQRAQDGVRLTVTLDRDRIAPDGLLLATATVENVGAAVITWRHPGGCDAATSISIQRVDPPTRAEFGRDWGGNLGILKATLVGIWGSATHHDLFVEGSVASAEAACGANLTSSDLQPGESKTDELAWRAEGPLGMPIRPGTYFVSAVFQRAAGSGDEVTLGFSVEVEGDEIDYLDPGEVVDAAFSDPRFRDPLVDVPPGRWIVTTFEFVNDRWVITVPVGLPDVPLALDYRVVAEVDPHTGSVLDVRVEEPND